MKWIVDAVVGADGERGVKRKRGEVSLWSRSWVVVCSLRGIERDSMVAVR